MAIRVLRREGVFCSCRSLGCVLTHTSPPPPLLVSPPPAGVSSRSPGAWCFTRFCVICSFFRWSHEPLQQSGNHKPLETLTSPCLPDVLLIAPTRAWQRPLRGSFLAAVSLMKDSPTAPKDNSNRHFVKTSLSSPGILHTNSVLWSSASCGELAVRNGIVCDSVTPAIFRRRAVTELRAGVNSYINGGRSMEYAASLD